MDLATRRQIIKGIRKKDENSCRQYNQIILEILEPSIKKESSRLYLLNERFFRDYEYNDFYQDFVDIVLKTVNSKRFYSLFETAKDFNEFKRYLSGTYKRIKFKTYNRWEKLYNKKKNSILINFFEEEIEDMIFNSNPALYYRNEDVLKKFGMLLSKAISAIKNPIRRKVLILLYENHFSNKKIAQVLGLNSNTVASHIFRALPELRSILKDLDSE